MNISSGASSSLPFSQFGELMTAQVTPQAAWRFNYGVINSLFTPTIANGGTVTVDTDRARLSTSANPAGLARVETIRRIRYLNGFGAFMIFTAVFSAPAANSSQLIGIGDTLDRVFMGYIDLDFVVGYQNNGGMPTVFVASHWNGVAPTFATAFGNIYKLEFGYLGYKGPDYSIYDPAPQKRRLVHLHCVDYANTNANVFIRNPTLPMFAEVRNTGNASDIVLYTPSAMGGVQGVVGGETVNPLDVTRSQDITTTFNNTNENHVFSLQNKATAFVGPINNRVPIAVRRIGLSRSASGAATAVIRVYRNATTAPVRVFTDQDTNNSPAAFSTTAAVLAAGASERTYTLTANKTDHDIEMSSAEFLVYPGQDVMITVQLSLPLATDITVTETWEEQF